MLTKAEIARLRSLHEKRHREALGLYLVEGEKVLGELLRAGVRFRELYALPDSPIPEAAGSTAVRRISAEEMARISHYPTPSTVLAVGALVRKPVAPADLARGFTLALDAVQDAGNVGTLLRIADWYALDRVLLSPECADLFSQKVINASMGSFARVSVHAAPLAPLLSACGVPVLGCDLEGVPVHQLEAPRNAVVVIGSEGRGISRDVAACLTQRLTIPRYGGAESLNAGVAAGIVCDNLRRLAR